jgi:hypothetical protein
VIGGKRFVFTTCAQSLSPKNIRHAAPGVKALTEVFGRMWLAREEAVSRRRRPAWPRYDPAMGDVLSATNTGVAFGPDPLKECLDL